MNEEPLVSVVIPTYSRPIYLKRCIDSVLKQTYSNIEIIVVDDNNPDTREREETQSVMQEYADNPKVKYIKHEHNKNGSAARNTGWKSANGSYISFIDDDDEMKPNRVKRQIECLMGLDDSWGVCYTAYSVVKESGTIHTSTENRYGDCYVDALSRTFYVLGGSNLMLRKQVVDSVNGFDESFARNQDIEFLVRILEHNKIAYINEDLLIVHQEGERRKRSFEEIDGYTQYYLKKFTPRIQKLDKKDRERVIAIISLERSRTAFQDRKILKGIRIIIENKVSFHYCMKYLKYVLDRVITHSSYGFSG